MKKVCLIFTLVLSLSFVGCNFKSSINASQTQNKSDSKSTTVDYQNVIENFLKQKNLKTIVNSGAAEDIQLPNDFKAVKDDVAVGSMLEQRNELSRKNQLDFSKYMGQKVKMYTTQIDTGESKSNYDIVIFISENKIVGYWVEAGIKGSKQNRPDFNVLVDLLRVR